MGEKPITPQEQRERLAHIDKNIADIRAADHKQRNRLAPWQIVVIMVSAASALFSAGILLIKLFP